MEYEYADPSGGGQRPARGLLQDGESVHAADDARYRARLRQEDITVVGFESIQWYGTDTPTSSVSLDQLPEPPRARKVYDVRRDAESGEYGVDTTKLERTTVRSDSDGNFQEDTTMTGPKYSRRGMLGSAIAGVLRLFVPGKNCGGQITSVSPPHWLSISTYDREGRLIAVSDQLDETMSYVQDQNRRHRSGL